MDTILAISCGDPTGSLISANQIYRDGPSIPTPPNDGAYIYVLCITGYVWNDAASIKSIRCTSNGTWELISATCQKVKVMYLQNIAMHKKKVN